MSLAISILVIIIGALVGFIAAMMLKIKQLEGLNLTFYGSGYMQALQDEGYPRSEALRRALEEVRK